MYGEKIRDNHEQLLLRMQSFKYEDVESDMMKDGEVMRRNVQLFKSTEYCPLTKGTSNEKEARELLERVIVSVSVKEPKTRNSTLSTGRSNQSINYQSSYLIKSNSLFL